MKLEITAPTKTTAPRVAEQKLVDLVGYHDLNGKPAFKLAMQKVGSHYYLYVGSMWHRGWSILDVTDPTEPKLENFVAGPENTWTTQLQVANGLMITSLEQAHKLWGMDLEAPFAETAYFWDVKSDPVHPKLLSHYKIGGTGCHRNYYSGGKYIFMTANEKGFLGNFLIILDISDPSHPKEVSRWWLPGQNVGAGEKPEREQDWKRPRFFHGPAYVEGTTAYLSYGRFGLVVLDVSNIHSPKMLCRFSFGELGQILGGSPGCHSAVPIHGRNLLVVTSEATENPPDAINDYNFVFMMDTKDPTTPRVLSQFPQPVPSNNLPYESYQEKGGLFGPHNLHHWQYQDCLFNPKNTVFATFCNAGLRVFDVTNAYVPKEVGYYVPEDPKVRFGPRPIRKLVIDIDDVIVDDRGYAYCSEKNSGLYVLKYNGPMS